MRQFEQCKSYKTAKMAEQKVAKLDLIKGLKWFVTVNSSGRFVPVVMVATEAGSLIRYLAEKGIAVMWQ